MLDYAAFPDQRQKKIRELLNSNGRVVCTVLAREMNVSEHTIRRDLNELAQEGICKRVHGGAVSMLEESGTFEQRIGQNQAEKVKIAHKCVSLIKKGGCIFIDSGSTNLEIARSIPDDLSISAVTNSPSIALELMKKTHCEVILIGGKLNSQIGASVGNSAIYQISQIHFDQCFIGGCALDPQIGITIFDFEEAEFKKALIRQSNQIIMGVTADKLPGVARYVIADCEQLSVLVIDKPMTADLNQLFDEKLMRVLFA
ncbi:DeoR/GlpR family DNA-binding transcription regulator [Providencia burhodogranariea]|uniref:DeoR family transcriptional regulator n=1 Tax=Providencia burhodogranariea DSM 19968 TaxID=1141662 RepID=K8X3J3_9GAMM|nr:DeoR/GlpR family DNA-binding transcription regulator [Providencia burhodogranariea]EKT63025.1 DeoR family transcriptional regulator [Providencia burhodogranariea DSM 19968]